MSGQQDRESGMTMVELIIAVSMAVVVGLLAMWVMINTLRTQTTVAGNTIAYTNAQAVSTALDQSIRGATRFTTVSSSEVRICGNAAGTAWQDFKVVADPQAKPGGPPSMLQHTTSTTIGTPPVLAHGVNSITFDRTGQELHYVLTMGKTSADGGVVIDRRVVQRSPDPASGLC